MQGLSFLSLRGFFSLVLFHHPQTCQHLMCISKSAESGAWRLKLPKESPGNVEEWSGSVVSARLQCSCWEEGAERGVGAARQVTLSQQLALSSHLHSQMV